MSLYSADRIGIIGAGIGGLTLQIALRARGIDCIIFEQAQELTEIGAAVASSLVGWTRGESAGFAITQFAQGDPLDRRT